MWKRTAVIAVIVMAMLGQTTSALADGTETLGPPSITIAEGTGVATGGTGMAVQPAAFDVSVPSDATVKQVLLYWEGQFGPGPGGPWPPSTGDDTIVVNGHEVSGMSIGGPTTFFERVSSQTFRTDITSLGLVRAGTTTITVDGLDFDYANNGAGVAVIYDEPQGAADVQLRDGSDLAYADFGAPLDQTVPQTYTFAAADRDRVADLTLYATSVEPNRPNVIEVTVGDADPIAYADLLSSAQGAQWDTVKLPVEIPAGETTVSVEVVSRRDDSGRQPASLAWIGSFLTVPEVQAPDPGGCTYTPEYWKKNWRKHPLAFLAWLWWRISPTSGFFDSGRSWEGVLKDNPTGVEAYWYLSHAYIGAQLNDWNGADTGPIDDDLAEAKSLLRQYAKKKHSIEGPVHEEFVRLAETLANFNNGVFGPGPCRR